VVKPKPKGADSRRVFYIALIVLLVAGVAALSVLTARSGNKVTQVDTTAPIPNQGHALGSDSAPVKVVEFGDFECPACGNFANLTEPDIRTRLVNTGEVQFRFIDFPLPMHQNTRAAHLAAWCAGEQGKFWEMHDLLYQNQDRWNGETTRRPGGVFEDLAKQAGVNVDQFKSCVDARKYVPQIQANVDEGVKRGVPSTPTFIIGNKQVSSAIPYDEFKRYVDEARAAARPTASGPATKSAPATKAATKTSR
jgi:protein-disulfide isomerase